MNVIDARELFWKKRKLDSKGHAPQMVRRILAHYRAHETILQKWMEAA